MALQASDLLGEIPGLTEHRLDVGHLEEPTGRSRRGNGLAKVASGFVVISPDEGHLGEPDMGIGGLGIRASGVVVTLLGASEVAAPEGPIADLDEFLGSARPVGMAGRRNRGRCRCRACWQKVGEPEAARPDLHRREGGGCRAEPAERERDARASARGGRRRLLARTRRPDETGGDVGVGRAVSPPTSARISRERGGPSGMDE